MSPVLKVALLGMKSSISSHVPSLEVLSLSLSVSYHHRHHHHHNHHHFNYHPHHHLFIYIYTSLSVHLCVFLSTAGFYTNAIFLPFMSENERDVPSCLHEENMGFLVVVHSFLQIQNIFLKVFYNEVIDSPEFVLCCSVFAVSSI